MAPPVVLGGDEYLRIFTPSELQAIALTSLKLHAFAFSISMVLFGLQCFITGYLIVRSRFLPRILGVLLAMGGSAYVIVSFTKFLSPSLGATLSPFIAPAGLVGEGSLTVWFLVRGVNVPRWMEVASGLTATKPEARRV